MVKPLCTVPPVTSANTGAPRAISASELTEALPVGDAIDALEAALSSEGLPAAPPRTHLDSDRGTLLVMPAAAGTRMGVKLVTVAPGNPARSLPLIHGLYVLFSEDTLQPAALLDGAALTRIRTAAVSGLATRHLAPESARRLVLFGAGVQATEHLEAMACVRPIESVTVVAPPGARRDALVARAAELGLASVAGDPSAVAEADIVCTCTTSAEPVFDGDLLAAGAHVNATGSYQPGAREVDARCVERAYVVAETRQVAMAEAGDLLIPLAEGALAGDPVDAELADVVRGDARPPDGAITLFKSVGHAYEDLVLATAVAQRIDRQTMKEAAR
jgi:ornithine cyclodeaminase/alanine dehydrogenase-like protein (mu-crystallin family)